MLVQSRNIQLLVWSAARLYPAQTLLKIVFRIRETVKFDINQSLGIPFVSVARPPCTPQHHYAKYSKISSWPLDFICGKDGGQTSITCVFRLAIWTVCVMFYFQYFTEAAVQRITGLTPVLYYRTGLLKGKHIKYCGNKYKDLRVSAIACKTWL